MRISFQKNITIKDIVVISILSLVGIFMLIPFFWMLSVSFERGANVQPPFPPRFIPDEFSFFNYSLVFENGGLLNAYFNSFIVALGSVLLNVISSLLAGYAFAKGNFKGKNTLFVIILTTMMIPREVTIIPMYLMFNQLNLLNTFYPLILPGLLFGFGVILSKQYFVKMPDSLKDAAEIDGLHEFGIFLRIFIPLAGPIIATQVILSSMYSWNSFLWPRIILTGSKLQTVPIYLATFSQENGSRLAGLTMASASASIIPIVIVFLVLQKYIIQSVALSGLKE